MQSDYIRREDAVNACQEGWNNSVQDCINNIKALKPADVAPVVHGRWKKQYRYQVNSICSVCGNEVGRCTRYCPNCGAKMDKGD